MLMCSVFGLIDYQNKLTTREKNRFINTLTRECEIRGTDATGIAYHFGGRLRIFKRPLPAHKLRLRVPPGASVVMGHTRMTTQGNEKFNQNNHPFAGSIGGKDLRPCPQRHPVERQAAAGNRAFAANQRRNRQLCCSAAFGKAKRPRLCQPKNYG